MAGAGQKGAGAIDAIAKFVDQNASTGGVDLRSGGDTAARGSETHGATGGDCRGGVDAAASGEADGSGEVGIAEGRGLGEIGAGSSGREGLAALEAHEPGTAGKR